MSLPLSVVTDDSGRLDIFTYLDYRGFCRDFYHWKKKTDSRFSFRSFAREAQVAGSYLKHIMDGARNLSPEMCHKFGLGMGLDAKEIDYFETLVRFNQAISIEEKAVYLDRLRRKKSRALKPMGMADAVHLLSHWYVVAIKEIIVTLNSDNASLIQRVLRKKIPESLVDRTIQELKDLGWIFLSNGRWSSQVSQIQFPDEVKSYVVRSFHRQMLELAVEGLEDELSTREYGAAVFTFPKSEFLKLKEKIKDLQLELVGFVQDLASQTADQKQGVYHFGIQCFSLQDSKENDDANH